LAITGDKHIDKNQIIFNVEGDTFKVKIGEDLDLQDVYTVLVSAVIHLEELALENEAPPSNELH
jgi:hypothetical protein